MLEGFCPKCKTRYSGWSLIVPDKQMCENCGAALEICYHMGNSATAPLAVMKDKVPNPDTITNDKNNQSTELIAQLTALNAALRNHAEILIKNNASMEQLNLAIKRLDSSLRTELRLETTQSSLMLKQGVTEFVNSCINPRFYSTTQLRLTDRRS